jgi:uncharacterized Zn-finger protein
VVLFNFCVLFVQSSPVKEVSMNNQRKEKVELISDEEIMSEDDSKDCSPSPLSDGLDSTNHVDQNVQNASAGLSDVWQSIRQVRVSAERMQQTSGSSDEDALPVASKFEAVETSHDRDKCLFTLKLRKSSRGKGKYAIQPEPSDPVATVSLRGAADDWAKNTSSRRHANLECRSDAARSSISVNAPKLQKKNVSGGRGEGYDASSLACATCGKKCTRASALTRHARSHAALTFRCSLCDVSFSNPIEYKRHAVSEHGSQRVFKCTFDGCQFAADRLSTVERHAVIHSQVHVHSCNRCGRTFAQENGLHSHLRSCLETRSYLCDLCGAAFNHLQSMQSHRRVHTGEKPFQCTDCGSHFADYRNLKRHRRIHDNTFPYVCVVCSKKFRHSNSLKSHLASHQVV